MKKFNKVLTTACLLTMVTWVNSLAATTSEIIENDLKSSVVETVNNDDTTMKLNYEITPDDVDEPKTSTNIKNVFFAFKSNLLGDTTLPSSYNTVDNLKSKKILLNVKDQHNTDSCWAFAANNVLNAYMATKSSAQNSMTNAQEYSVKHMDFGTSQNINGTSYNKKGFYRKVGTNGNYNLAISYWTNGLGAIEKMDDEENFYSNYNQNSNYTMDAETLNQGADLQINDVTQFATIMKLNNNGNIKYYSESGSEIDEATVTNIRKQIKENIKKYGAVTASTIRRK